MNDVRNKISGLLSPFVSKSRNSSELFVRKIGKLFIQLTTVIIYGGSLSTKLAVMAGWGLISPASRGVKKPFGESPAGGGRFGR